MKSIIIIIALFLVTLTTKADWVKSVELDSLYLGDAPITFSKYSPDYTKFVTYSAQDSTLRLWDLGTGQVIKERTFEWSYKFDLCEFDFENEMFYMVKNTGNLYPGSFATTNPDGSSQGTDRYYRLWKIGFSNAILNVIIFEWYYTTYPSGKYPTVKTTSYNCDYISVGENSISLYYKVKAFTRYNIYSGNETSDTYYYFRYIQVNKINNTLIMRDGENIIAKDYRSYHNGNAISFLNNGNVNYKFGFGDTLENIAKYDTNILIKKYPYLPNILSIIDINYNTLVYKDKKGEVLFYNYEKDVMFDYGINKNLISRINTDNIKLVSSPKYSIMFGDSNKLYLYDNAEKYLIDSIYIPKGTIGYNRTSNSVYTKVNNIIYKNKFKSKIGNFADIWTNRNRFLIGEKVLINTILPKVSSLKITVNNVNYYTNELELSNLKIGFYNVKLSYTEDGVNRVLIRDSLFKVEDSLKLSYQVNSSNSNFANGSFEFTLNSNISISSYTWSYFYPVYKYTFLPYYDMKYQNVVNQNALFDVRLIGDNTGIKLSYTTGLQDTIIKVDINVKPYLNAIFSKYSGIAPLEFNIIFDKTYLFYNGQYDTTFARLYSYKEYKIGSLIKKRSAGNKRDSVYETISIPGIYQIQLVSPNHLGDFTLTLDSVLTVLAPSDIQDFAERKYIFKQDADGIYCQLEGEGEVALYDNVGRLVRVYQIENERYIRKEDLERGVYFLSIQTNGNVYHEKVLVE